MNDSYKIEKPASDLNFLTIGIKYIVLFIVLFLGSWIAIPLFVSKGRTTRVNTTAEFLFENPLWSSLLISIGVITWFIYRTIKKYKFGEVFKIDFNDSDKKLEVKTVNLANNQEKDNYYDYKNLSFDLQNIEDSLFGKQRILKIKNYDQTVHEINIDRTAWCRNERIEKLIEKIKTGHNTVYKT
ncbi:hypothetical protein JoomaDRAFT_3946 [Galbibacter orientalis DSM 19592]|uniref:Uncharacterized protein n=1 Tax=Galbibacter orientalis DSM 19592 TaxID=926559 RepID=I3CB78_9FLAO|nr:hypothetical protein [Galbibacter orientalis]EIJ40871.1 hypothetical protein JoomaDRAFT_3946 [Galbibacter orientalis DSM 19592]